MSPTELVETGRGIAHRWLCDGMGHMNSRHIAALFDDAGHHFVAWLTRDLTGVFPSMGWADVRTVDEFKREVSEGTLLVVQSRLIRVGQRSLAIEHQASGVLDRELRATREVIVVCFDLEKRSARPLPDELRTAIANLPAEKGTD